MSLAWMITAGVGAGTGLVCTAAALAPRRRDLNSIVGQRWRISPEAPDEESRLQALGRILAVDVERAGALVRLPGSDLALLERTVTAHGLRKLAGAALGALAPALVGVAALLLGLTPPLAATSGAVLALAAAGFVLPDIAARRRAARARAHARHGLGTYLMLVAAERQTGAAAQQALIGAATVPDAPLFTRIRASIDRAQLQRRPAWEGLRDLADKIAVPELADCADIMSATTHGGAVTDTLIARARSLRSETLASQRRAANDASQRMVIPAALLALCFIALLIYPVLIRLTTA